MDLIFGDTKKMLKFLKERKKYSLFRRCEWSKKDTLLIEIYVHEIMNDCGLNIH